MAHSFAAIVPMRHESERVPGKNYRLFNGLPLYHHIVRTLLDCPEIDHVMIDTDSEWILEDASTHFPTVIRYVRPEALRDGMISMNEVLMNSVEQIEANFYLQTHSTNPLLKARSVSSAIRRFTEGQPEHDSLFSVTRLQARLWDRHQRPVNHDPSQLLRTQDLEPLFEENSCIYLFSSQSLTQNGNRIGHRPILFELDRLEALDIDTEADFQLAEVVAQVIDRGEEP